MIVEVDGFQDAESATDQRRTEWLNTNGYSVLRFWNQEISRERRWVLETILAALQGRLELSSELPSFYFASRFTDQG
ncbi:very-short-patch-repair endonuclease [Rhizobium sp. BK456]|nr:very-short-patch-repair endonuclease [Rhizobium sp. BK456]